MVSVGTKMNGTTIVGLDICHQRTTSRKLYSMTMTYFLKEKIENVNISQTVRANTKMNRITFIVLIIANKWHHYKSCTRWHLPTFFWDQNVEMFNISEIELRQKWAMTENFNNTFLSVKCKWLQSCSCRIVSTCAALAVELLLSVLQAKTVLGSPVVKTGF